MLKTIPLHALWLLLALGTLAGCAESKESAASPETPTAAAPVADDSKKEPPGKKAVGQSFELEAFADHAYPIGEATHFSIGLKGRDGWHINTEFPLRIELQAPGALGLGKDTFERGDAASFADASARFDVPFKPAEAGSHEVLANVSFAMCTDENCILEERKLALALQVK